MSKAIQSLHEIKALTSPSVTQPVASHPGRARQQTHRGDPAAPRDTCLWGLDHLPGVYFQVPPTGTGQCALEGPCGEPCQSPSSPVRPCTLRGLEPVPRLRSHGTSVVCLLYTLWYRDEAQGPWASVVSTPRPSLVRQVSVAGGFDREVGRLSQQSDRLGTCSSALQPLL